MRGDTALLQLICNPGRNFFMRPFVLSKPPMLVSCQHQFKSEIHDFLLSIQVVSSPASSISGACVVYYELHHCDAQ
jgi:hypothetical protein